MHTLLILFLFLTLTQSIYNQIDLWEGPNFFSNFNFFTANDPTHGYVNFVSYEEALSKNLLSAPPVPSPIIIRADNTSIASGRGRNSIRINSKKTWTVKPGSPYYLFVIDLNHLPSGCSTWPAWWFVGPNWPNGGEIDVIEGVNTNTKNSYTLHTSSGCSRQAGNCGTGTPSNHPSCQSSGADNAGCGITGAAGTYGVPLNDAGGGVFAMSWEIGRISAWFFPRGKVPGDLRREAVEAQPKNWGEAVAFWELGKNCGYEHFSNMEMIFDLTFCGDWAGATFNSSCSHLGNKGCTEYVKDHPEAFTEAYWSVNFVKILQEVGGVI